MEIRYPELPVLLKFEQFQFEQFQFEQRKQFKFRRQFQLDEL